MQKLIRSVCFLYLSLTLSFGGETNGGKSIAPYESVPYIFNCLFVRFKTGEVRRTLWLLNNSSEVKKLSRVFIGLRFRDSKDGLLHLTDTSGLGAGSMSTAYECGHGPILLSPGEAIIIGDQILTPINEKIEIKSVQINEGEDDVRIISTHADGGAFMPP